MLVRWTATAMAETSSEDYIQTLGVNFMEKTISIRNTEITFSVGVLLNGILLTLPDLGSRRATRIRIDAASCLQRCRGYPLYV
jgi:hypothetical protein